MITLQVEVQRSFARFKEKRDSLIRETINFSTSLRTRDNFTMYRFSASPRSQRSRTAQESDLIGDLFWSSPNRPNEARRMDLFPIPTSTPSDLSDDDIYPESFGSMDSEGTCFVWVQDTGFSAVSCADLYDSVCRAFTWNLGSFVLTSVGVNLPYSESLFLSSFVIDYEELCVEWQELDLDHPSVVNLQSVEFCESCTRYMFDVGQCWFLEPTARVRLCRRLRALRWGRLPRYVQYVQRNRVRRYEPRPVPQEQSDVAGAFFHEQEHYKFQFGSREVEINLPLWIESLSCLFAQLSVVRTTGEGYLAIGAFVRSITGRSLTVHYGTKIIDFMLWCANVEVDSDFEDTPVPTWREMSPDDVEIFDDVREQSGPTFDNPFSEFRSFFNSVDAVKDSPGLKKMQSVFMYLIANSVLDKIGISMDSCDFSEASKNYYKEKYRFGFGFVYAVLDGVSYILERIYTAWVSKDIGAMWHTEAVYDKFADEFAQIKVDALGLCNPDAFDLNYHEFISRVDSCLDDGRRIVKFVTKRDKSKVQALIYELEKIRATEVIQKAAARGRRMPFGILLYGKSGVLKTTLEDVLGTHYGRVRSLPLGHDFRYTIVPTAEYMSGFTSKMWWLKIDDAAAIRPGVIGDLDPSIRDILQIYNNAGWCPPQAELELKGKTPCYAEFASITTNTLDLNAQHYFNNDVAIRRRCLFHIDVSVKPQYRLAGAERADTSKIPEVRDGEYPNIWHLKVQEVKEVNDNGQTRAALRTIFETDDIYAFLRFYTDRIKRHAHEQDMQRKTAQIIREAPTCPHCYLPEVACECVDPLPTEQGLETRDLLCVAGLLAAQTIGSIYIGSKLVDRLCSHIPSMASHGRQAVLDVVHDVATAPSTRDAVGVVVTAARERAMSELREAERTLREEMREALRTARDSYFGPIKKLTAAIAALAGMYLLYKMSQPSQNQQSSDVEIPTAKPKAADSDENVWFDANYRVSELDRGCPAPANQYDSICAKIQRNTGHVVVRRQEDGRTYASRGNIVCVGGQLYVGNKHVLIRDSEEVELTIRFDSNVGLSETVVVKLHRSEFYVHPTQDLAFVVIGALPPRRRITQFMSERNANFGVCDGSILHTRETGEREVTALRAGRCNLEWSAGQWKNVPCWEGKPSKPTVVGDCGAPYVMKTQKGPLLAGIHFAGSAARAYCLMLSREECDTAAQKLEHVIVEQGVVSLADVDGNDITLTPLHNKSVIRYLEGGQGRCFGSLPGFRAKHKSRIARTYIYDLVRDMGYPDNFGPPEMKGWEIWRNAIYPVVNQPLLANRQEFRLVADAYFNDITAGLDTEWKNEFVPLDDASVVNGFPGCKFIDALNKQTSMGFPWRKRKEVYLVPVVPPEEPYQEQWRFDAAFMERVNRIRRAHLCGEMSHPVFVAHMKDEPRKWKRVASKDTRQMSGCPADFLFHTRQYLLPFVRIFQSNSLLFEGAPGINHRSMSWDTLFHFLTAFGDDQMVAGDFKHYDKGMQAVVLMSVFSFIHRFALWCGWDEIQARVILCIGYDLTFVFMDFNGDLVQFFGSNSSGHCLTVIVNCIANSFYMRFAFMRCGLDLADFKKVVHLITYGDDNESGISPEVSDVYNHTSIRDHLADIGVVYTMADKSTTSIPLISVWDTTFLKRGWRFEPELGCIVAPLEEASIGKMLTKCIPSDTLCPEAHACAVISNAVSEYALYGRERFMKEYRRFESLIDRADIRDYMLHPLPTFDDLMQGMRDKLLDCECVINDYERDPHYATVVQWETGENYIVRPRGEPKCSTHTQLLCEDDELVRASVGDASIHPGDPRSSFSGELLVDGQIDSTSASEIRFTTGGCTYQPTETNCERELGKLSERNLRKLEPFVEMQSQEIAEPANTSMEMLTAENITFSGGAASVPVDESGLVSSADQSIDVDDAAALGRFLSRPVLIHSLTWAEDSVFTPVILQPWALFFSDTYIQNKLVNYARLRCKLRLKFIVNASPFYYGSLRASYFPLDVGPDGRATFGTSSNNLIRYSQPPGVYLEPQSMSTVEMTLPFVWPGDWLDTADLGQFNEVGTIGIVQYARLLSANGVVGAGVSVKVYAWAEDVEIAGLTKAPLLQSDEYEETDGAISAPATAVASVARLASNVPVIGPYAKMAEFGANAISGVAKMFGYSNPPVIEDSKPVTVKSFHALANTDVCVPLDVLALDPKNELAVSSAVNGYTGEDELAIASLCTRESFLLGSVWTSAQATNVPIFTSAVHPGLIGIDAVVPQVLHYTPMAYVGEMFRYWRGSLKFKFRFIKTKYHRGRVSITWDPNFNIQTDADTETTNLTRIVDIEEESEVEMVIPYKSSQPYLLFNGDGQFTNSTTPSITYDKDYHNGVIVMRVQNILTGPAALPSITVLMYVSAGDDLEYQVPQELTDEYTIWPTAPALLSLDVPEEQSQSVLDSVGEPSNKGAVTTGERVASVRTLLHRTSLWSTQVSGSLWDQSDVLFTSGWRRTHNYLPKVPIGYGYNPQGANWSGTSPFSFSKNHPIDWVLNLFAGYKGSTNMTFNVNSGNSVSGNATDISEFSVSRHYGPNLVRPSKQNRNAATDFNSAIAPSSISRTMTINGAGAVTPAAASGQTGISLTNIRTQAALQAHVPQYSNRRFLVAWGRYRNIDLIGVGDIYENVDVALHWFQQQVAASGVPWPVIDIYYSAGIDFNPFFFVCTPRITVLTPPSANNAAAPS